MDGLVNKALRNCNVSRSGVEVAYNNRWLETEPSEQVFCCLGATIPVLSNGLAKVLLVGKNSRLVLEANVTSKAECAARICCLAFNVPGIDLLSGGFCKVELWRDGRFVMESLFCVSVSACNRSSVLVWTLRRGNHVVQSLQLGDQIRVYFSFHDTRALIVEAGVCVVHNDEDEGLVLAVNSVVLSRSKSEDLPSQFWAAGLKDNLGEQLTCGRNEWGLSGSQFEGAS